MTDQLINEGLDAAVKQENLRVLSVTAVDPAADNDESKYTFSLKVILAPEVPLPDYKGLSITVPKREVTDEMVETVLQRQREQLADYPAGGSRGAAGDFVTIDYTATLDGAAGDGTASGGAALHRGEHRLYAESGRREFPSGLLRAVGRHDARRDPRSESRPCRRKASMKPSRAKKSSITVTLTEVKEADLPELNDEFAGRIVAGQDSRRSPRT